MNVPPATLQDARAAAVDELLRRDFARQLAQATTIEHARMRRMLEAAERRASFHVVR